MKITKEYLRTVIKEELERLEETSIAPGGNVAGYLKKAADLGIRQAGRGEEASETAKIIIDTWKDAANQEKLKNGYGGANNFKYVMINLQHPIENLEKLLKDTPGRGTYINPSDKTANRNTRQKLNTALEEVSKTEPSVKTINKDHRKDLKKFSKLNPGATSDSIKRHNERVQLRQAAFVDYFEEISKLLQMLVGGEAVKSNANLSDTQYSKVPTRGEY